VNWRADRRGKLMTVELGDEKVAIITGEIRHVDGGVSAGH
jgi:hypothetical protein